MDQPSWPADQNWVRSAHVLRCASRVAAVAHWRDSLIQLLLQFVPFPLHGLAHLGLGVVELQVEVSVRLFPTRETT